MGNLISLFLKFSAFIIPTILLLFVLYNSIVNASGREIVVLERKWFGKKMKPGRVVAMKDEIGIQARILGPGLHFLIPFLYSTSKKEFIHIGKDQVGIIESIDGVPLENGQIFGRVVGGHNNFQDAESFLNNGGQRGPQIQIIGPGDYKINPYIFKVKVVPAIIVYSGEIGIINAEYGKPIESGRLLGKTISGHNNFQDGEAFLNNNGQRGPQTEILLPGTYRINTDIFKINVCQAIKIPPDKVGLIVALDGEPLPESEYVAKSITGHDDFQNGDKFLEKGGQRGPQFDVLRPGTYYINPLLFTVQLDDVAKVERGEVAVVVSNVGKEPEEVKKALENDKEETNSKIEDRLNNGIERYVVPSGYRGIQREVSGPGIYYLNKRAFMAYIIDTTNITIDWDNVENTKFDPLAVTSRDGFEINVSVKVIIRVRPDQAPYMVAKIGSIENLINHVIHPMIDSSFRNQASSTSAMNFMQDRQDEQKKAEERARLELEKYHVELISVLICQIGLPEDLMLTQTKRVIAEQERAMYKEQQLTEQERINAEKTKAEANQQANLMEAEIGVKIANQKKLTLIAEAEGKGEAERLEKQGQAKGIEAIGKAKGQEILAKGLAIAESYKKQNEALGGGNGLVSIEITRQISEGKIKVVPDTLITGNDSNGLMSGLLTSMLLNNMNNLDNKKDDIVDVKPEEPEKKEKIILTEDNECVNILEK